MKTRGLFQKFEGCFILDGVRTPMVDYMGALADANPIDLGIKAAKALFARSGMDAGDVDSVLSGNMAPGGFDQFYIARHIGLYSGVPLWVPALNVQRICGTGFELFRQAGEQLATGAATLALLVGTESMTRNPIAAFDHRGGFRLGAPVGFKDCMWEALTDPAAVSMIQTAENLAQQYGITRAEVDAFAASSFAKAVAAQQASWFEGETVAVVNETFELPGYKPRSLRLAGKAAVADRDTHPRPTPPEVLAKLRTVFKDGVQTGGNSSALTDAAAAALVADTATMQAWRDRTQRAVQRHDFKLEQLAPHLFMNVRIVDEHGRQLAIGRDLPGLKAELGGQARSAFQALAALKVVPPLSAAVPAAPATAASTASPASPASTASRGSSGVVAQLKPPAASPAVAAEAQPYTAWTFGALPELMEIRRGGQVLIGFPALLDRGTHVEVEVFDEPDVAAAKHRAGLRRLVSLQIKEPLKYLEKNIPDLPKMGVAVMALGGTVEELREQVIAVALDRAFLADPLPADEGSFAKRLAEGRTRLNLIAAEVARLAATVLAEHAAATRKLKDGKPPKEVADDITQQLQRLVPRRFLLETDWAALQQFVRYLKAVTLRLDKLRADPARDAARLAELRPVEQRYLRRLAEIKGAQHARLDEYRWLLEELRVSLFAQELRTPQPVSVKRLDKAWAQLSS